MRAATVFLLAWTAAVRAEEVDPLLEGVALPRATSVAPMRSSEKRFEGTLDAKNGLRTYEFSMRRGMEVRVTLEKLEGSLWVLKLDREAKKKDGTTYWAGAGGKAHIEGLPIRWSHVAKGSEGYEKYRLILQKWSSPETKYVVRVEMIARPDAKSGTDAGNGLPDALRLKPGVYEGFVGRNDPTDAYLIPNVAAGKKVEVRIIGIRDAFGEDVPFELGHTILKKVHCTPKGVPLWRNVARNKHVLNQHTAYPVVLEHTSDLPQHYLFMIGAAPARMLRYQFRVTIGVGRDPKPKLRYVLHAGKGRFHPLPKDHKLRFGEPVFVEARFDIVPDTVERKVKLDFGGGTAREIPVKRTKTDPKLYRSPAIVLKAR